MLEFIVFDRSALRVPETSLVYVVFDKLMSVKVDVGDASGDGVGVVDADSVGPEREALDCDTEADKDADGDNGIVAVKAVVFDRLPEPDGV